LPIRSARPLNRRIRCKTRQNLKSCSQRQIIHQPVDIVYGLPLGVRYTEGLTSPGYPIRHHTRRRPMRFYNGMHQYYCDIDLYAKQMYTCIIDNNGHKLMHRQRVTRLCGENERASNISSQTRCLAIEDARQRASSHPRYLFATGSA